MVVAAFSISATYAQSARNRWFPEKQNFGGIGERVNANTVTIASGNPDGTYLPIALDLAAVLDDGDEFRVIPLVGKGGGQNIRDVRFLKGVDLGITQSNLLNALRRSNEYGNLGNRLVYIAKLFGEEMHIVVRADSGVTSIEQLAGKKVSFGGVGTGTQLTARDLFDRLHIKVDEVNLTQGAAVQKLTAGEIAAMALVAGKPAGLMGRLAASQGLRFLPVPFSKPLQDDFLPGVLTHNDYPTMIPAGQDVDTISVSAVLIAYNWPKGSEPYRRLEDFVDRFFSRLTEFTEPPRHPKWRETNFAAVLPGWTRFEPAEDWLQRNRKLLLSRAAFNEFLKSRNSVGPFKSEEERERLFLDFVEWSREHERQ
jgi:TRAP transporter TAXI family solute receptor